MTALMVNTPKYSPREWSILEQEIRFRGAGLGAGYRFGQP